MSDIQEVSGSNERHIIEERAENSNCIKDEVGSDQTELREKLRFSIDSILQDRMKAMISSTTKHDVNKIGSSDSEGDSLHAETTFAKTEPIADSEKVSHMGANALVPGFIYLLFGQSGKLPSYSRSGIFPSITFCGTYSNRMGGTRYPSG
ncbi:hypothetical protein CHS0354_016636 [Potamilus streckersoni]|uniref:Uncharacterized protein n=1 Tax=Potamilus streckersoni TaxID=2493646 RepID=A0AAE0THJ3_9BIVA|nr:hypothetical protein CHS0354_016636 [Potamilus streckersoni]